MLRLELATSCLLLFTACGAKVNDIEDVARATWSGGATGTGGSGVTTVIPNGSGGQANVMPCGSAIPVNVTNDSACVSFSAEPELLQIDPMPCTFAIPTLPPGSVIDPGKLIVVLVPDASSGSAGACIVNHANSDCSQGDGWWMDTTSTILTLCAKSCEMLNYGAHLEVHAACRTGPTIV